jgi:hypothetical protein
MVKAHEYELTNDDICSIFTETKHAYSGYLIGMIS